MKTIIETLLEKYGYIALQLWESKWRACFTVIKSVDDDKRYDPKYSIDISADSFKELCDKLEEWHKNYIPEI